MNKASRLLLVALSTCLIQARCDSMEKALRAYGFTPVKPPSQLLKPGTLIWLSEKQPLVAGVICGSDKVMGDNWKPSESPTSNTELARTAKRGINFKVDASTFVTANVDAQSVKEVSLSIKNARLFELTDIEVQERTNQADRRCLRALQRRQRAGFTTSIVSQALMGDSTYHVKWSQDTNLSVQAKIAHLEMVAANLGLGNSTVTDKTITAEGLILGLKTDDFLAYLYSPENMAKADKSNRQSVMLPDWDGVVIDKEDSVSTTSAGDMPTLSDSQAESEYWQSINSGETSPRPETSP